jgi:sterol desaturase/sphingolipid hydroxylase (fatty acid hydroxylase superfamily)
MDWMAGARMHFVEIIVLRGATVIPMYILGFGATALHAYILIVYIHSTVVHANDEVRMTKSESNPNDE